MVGIISRYETLGEYYIYLFAFCWQIIVRGYQSYAAREKKSTTGIRINIVPIQLQHVQEEGKNMSQEEGKTKNLIWWVLLIAALVLVIVGGAYLRWKFWSGLF